MQSQVFSLPGIFEPVDDRHWCLFDSITKNCRLIIFTKSRIGGRQCYQVSLFLFFYTYLANHSFFVPLLQTKPHTITHAIVSAQWRTITHWRLTFWFAAQKMQFPLHLPHTQLLGFTLVSQSVCPSWFWIQSPPIQTKPSSNSHMTKKKLSTIQTSTRTVSQFLRCFCLLLRQIPITVLKQI